MESAKITILALAIAWGALEGCGGSSAVVAPKQDQSVLSVGEAKIGFTGHPAFNYVDFYPVPNVAATQLAYCEGGQIWSYSFATRRAQQAIRPYPADQ